MPWTSCRYRPAEHVPQSGFSFRTFSIKIVLCILENAAFSRMSRRKSLKVRKRGTAEHAEPKTQAIYKGERIGVFQEY